MKANRCLQQACRGELHAAGTHHTFARVAAFPPYDILGFEGIAARVKSAAGTLSVR